MLPCFPSQAHAYDDAPLCMARPPDRSTEQEEALLGLDGELSCLPGEVRETAGPLWTAPITAAEARSALLEADSLAQQGELANAMLKLRVVEHAMPRVADRIALRRAQLLLRMGNPDEAYDAFRIAEDSPERNVAAQARLGVVRGMLDSAKRQGEVELDKACKRYPNLGDRGSLRLSLARAKETWNNKAGAAAIYRTIDLSDPESAAAEAARTALTRLRAEGVPVKAYSPAELIERAERIVKTGTFDDARKAVGELCDDHSLPAAIRGRAHGLAARIARTEGDWEKAREEVATAVSLGAPDAQRYLPRGLPQAKDDAARAEQLAQGEAALRKLVGPPPYKRGKVQQLKLALDVAAKYELADAATELLEAIKVNKQAQPPLRFQSAILASGLASDESVLELLDTIVTNRSYRLPALYHRARALERLGRYTEADAEYQNVIQLDDSQTRYYGMWAGVRMAAMPHEDHNACPLEPEQPVDARAAGNCGAPRVEEVRGPGEGLLPEQTGALSHLPLPDANALELKRQSITLRLKPLIQEHGAAFPWLARAADLVQLDLYEDAADEIGEAYFAYRDARGSLRLRAGVDAVLTGSAPARHNAVGPLRRDRLSLGPQARLELSAISDLLGDPGFALKLREEQREARPRAYEDAVQAAAVKYGIEPNLLLAVMRVESVFTRQIVSFAGAVGLMQIMPRTGMLISRELGVEDFDVIDLLNPRTNLEFAAWYLSSLIKRFDGRLPLAIAAYNGGPHNVRVWMSGYPKNMPLDAFLEKIPFAETHRYVRRVLTNYAAYRAQQNLPMTPLSVELPEHKTDTIAF
ncbi:MAG TPA: lytic transglycosylase domain-containing protein [Polyangiales bacterium]|nr:lytic transglycosylase domain-containing protein [Polyangiales bacterium]